MLKLLSKSVQKVIASQFISKGDTKGLESWVDIPVQLFCSESIMPEGYIQYGVRVPIKPATFPLERCELGSKKKIYGFKPAYWFVGNKLGLKVLLREIVVVDSEEVVVRVRDGNYSCDAVIKRLI